MTDEMCPRGRSETVTQADVIEAAKSVDDPCFTTAEIASELPIGNERVRQRLGFLEEDEVLECKSAGSGTVYWFKRC